MNGLVVGAGESARGRKRPGEAGRAGAGAGGPPLAAVAFLAVARQIAQGFVRCCIGRVLLPSIKTNCHQTDRRAEKRRTGIGRREERNRGRRTEKRSKIGRDQCSVGVGRKTEEGSGRRVATRRPRGTGSVQRVCSLCSFVRSFVGSRVLEFLLRLSHLSSLVGW